MDTVHGIAGFWGQKSQRSKGKTSINPLRIKFTNILVDGVAIGLNWTKVHGRTDCELDVEVDKRTGWCIHVS